MEKGEGVGMYHVHAFVARRPGIVRGVDRALWTGRPGAKELCFSVPTSIRTVQSIGSP